MVLAAYVDGTPLSAVACFGVQLPSPALPMLTCRSLPGVQESSSRFIREPEESPGRASTPHQGVEDGLLRSHAGMMAERQTIAQPSLHTSIHVPLSHLTPT